MKNKFWFLVKHSLKKKYKSKSFIISNIILFILLIGIFNIDKILSFFGGDFAQETNIYVVDNKGVSDVLNAHIDNVYVVEVVRPDWLKNCPKSRIDRNQVADRDFKVSYRIMNDGDLDKLFRICDDCLAFLQKCAA